MAPMKYREWFLQHGEKHREIIRRLAADGLDETAMIAYFDFEHMRLREPGFCPLYAENRKCHPMEKLNCFFCACPHFRFSDAGLEGKGASALYSRCAVGSRGGSLLKTEKGIHQDCSGCFLPHRTGFIRKHFAADWFAAMAGCDEG